MHFLNYFKGQVVFTTELRGYATCSASYPGNKCYLGTTSGEVVCVDSCSGIHLHALKASHEAVNEVCTVGDRIFTCSDDKLVYE